MCSRMVLDYLEVNINLKKTNWDQEDMTPETFIKNIKEAMKIKFIERPIIIPPEAVEFFKKHGMIKPPHKK